jgi:hypothetical protein
MNFVALAFEYFFVSFDLFLGPVDITIPYKDCESQQYWDDIDYHLL